MARDYSHYPLVQKALDEQKRIFADFAGGIPEDLNRATQRALELIDGNVTDPDREDIMAVAVLMNCPPYIMLKSKRYAGEYSQHVQDMLDIHTARNGITPDNEDLIQVYSAMFVAHGENLLRKINEMDPPDAHWLRDVREGIEEYIEDRAAVERKTERGLLAAENAFISDLFTVIDQKAPKVMPGVFKLPPKPPGPKI